MKARLGRQMRKGDLVLFTGAGFSRGASTRSGEPLPSVWDLKVQLWRLAFRRTPGDDEVQGAALGDLFEVALERAGGQTRDLFSRQLTVDASTLPDRYRGWFSMPWVRHYTLNVDDLDEAVSGHFELPRQLESRSALIDDYAGGPNLLSIHLNGRVREFPRMTFSPRQYAKRLLHPDIWYQMLVADLVNHPVVFVGTTLDEASLWQYIEVREARGQGSVEVRPPSYLVTKDLPAPRAALLKKFNIDWIDATEQEFFEEALLPLAAEAEVGHQRIAGKYSRARGPEVALASLGDLRAASPPSDLTLFLTGTEPTCADVTSGHAITRAFEGPLAAKVAADSPDLVLLTGTAASGKSTTALRLALAEEARGVQVAVLDLPRSNADVGEIVRTVRRSGAEVVLIDDIDFVGVRAVRLIDELVASQPRIRVIAAIRSSRLQRLELCAEVSTSSTSETTVPLLTDADVDALVATLDRAHRLGRLAGMSTQDRRKALANQAGRQLVVAMFQATSGELLEERLHSECSDLAGEARIAYGMAAIATSERNFVLRDELVLGVGAVSGTLDNEALVAINKLVERNLLVAEHGEIRVRHRWIADTALDFYIDNGLLSQPLKGLLFALCTKVDPQSHRRSRQARLLHRLLNHAYLQRLTADIQQVRAIYSFVEDSLSWDYHYWLQRGSLEVELGDLAAAELFLNTAVSLAPDTEFRVTTEYAYLRLKKASNDPRAAGAMSSASEALRELEAAIANRGADDFYYFHIYGSQGLSWSRRGPLTRSDRVALVRQLWDTVKRGCELHPRNRELRVLAEDLQREYLSLAVA